MAMLQVRGRVLPLTLALPSLTRPHTPAPLAPLHSAHRSRHSSPPQPLRCPWHPLTVLLLLSLASVHDLAGAQHTNGRSSSCSSRSRSAAGARSPSCTQHAATPRSPPTLPFLSPLSVPALTARFSWCLSHHLRTPARNQLRVGRPSWTLSTSRPRACARGCAARGAPRARAEYTR